MFHASLILYITVNMEFIGSEGNVPIEIGLDLSRVTQLNTLPVRTAPFALQVNENPLYSQITTQFQHGFYS